MADPVFQLTDEQLDALIAQKQAAAQGNASASAQGGTPSTMEDIKATAPAAAQRGVLQAVPQVAIPTLADVGAGVVQGGANYVTGDQGNPVSRGAYAVHQMLEPYTAGGYIAEHPDLQTQAKTPGGKFAQTALEWAPSVLMGAAGSEAPMAAIGKGMIASAGSEAAGQASEGKPWQPLAQIGGGILGHSAPAMARGVVSPGGVGPEDAPRLAAAQTLKDAGFTPMASDTTNSRLMALLEGASPAPDMSEKLLTDAGVVRKPGPYESRDKVISALKGSLTGPGSRVEDLKANTNLYPTPQLTQGIANIAGEHALAHPTSSSVYNPQIDKAYNDYLDYATTGKLSGKQYLDLRQSWNDSGVPELQQMSKLLDAGMNASNNGPKYQGAWPKYFNDYANMKGIQAGQRAAGDNQSPLSPKVVANAIKKDTPLKALAQAGTDIYDNRPEPYSPTPGLLALGGLGSVGGYYHGAQVGHGAEESLSAALQLPTLGGLAGYGASKVARTAPVQAYAKNQLWQPTTANSLDPANVARILALRAPSGGQAMLDQPQQKQ